MNAINVNENTGFPFHSYQHKFAANSNRPIAGIRRSNKIVRLNAKRVFASFSQLHQTDAAYYQLVAYSGAKSTSRR